MLIDGIELMEGSEARNLTVARAQLREIFASAQTPALIDPEDQQVLVPSRPVDIDEYEFYYVPISMLPEGVEPMEATHRLVKPAEKPELLEGMPPWPEADTSYMDGLMMVKDQDTVYLAAKKIPPIGLPIIN